MCTVIRLILPVILMLASSKVFSQKQFDLVIQNVLVFDGNNFQPRKNVYVKDGVIIKLGNSNQKEAIGAKEVIDGSNKTLLPGLINAHLHIQQSDDLKIAAKAGVLTVLNLFSPTEDSIAAYKKLGQTAAYADFYTAGIGADMPNAVLKTMTGESFAKSPLTKSEAVKYIQDRKKNGVDFIKLFQESAVKEKFSDSIFSAIISAAHKQQLPVTTHAGMLKDAIFANKNGTDVLAHLWRDTLISDQQLIEWKKRPFSITPTLLVHNIVIEQLKPKSYPYAFTVYRNEVKRLKDAGITILAGTDAPNFGINFGDDLYKELFFYYEAGLTITESLRTAGINVAKAYKLKNKGEIRKGYSADFLLIDGDLSTDIYLLKNMTGIWKNGQRIK